MTQFCCIWTYQGLILILYLMGVLQLLNTQRQHKTFVFFTKIKAKNNYLKFLVNRIITELLLQCIDWLRNTLLHLIHRKKLSHSVGKIRSYEKIFPRLTEISVSCRRDLGLAGKLSAHMNWNLLLVKITIMAGSRWNYYPA